MTTEGQGKRPRLEARLLMKRPLQFGQDAHIFPGTEVSFMVPEVSGRRFPPIGRIILVLFFKRTERPFGRRMLFLLLESNGSAYSGALNTTFEAYTKVSAGSAASGGHDIFGRGD